MPDNEGTKKTLICSDGGKGKNYWVEKESDLNANQNGLFEDVGKRKIKNNCYMAF